MKLSKENYASFLKAFKQAYTVKFEITTLGELSLISWSAPAIVTITLSWERDGIKSEYVVECDANLTYAMDDIESVGKVSYTTSIAASGLSYLFNGLCKDGDITFVCEIADCLHKSATKIELFANVTSGKNYYHNVPVGTIVTSYEWSLTKHPRKEVNVPV